METMQAGGEQPAKTAPKTMQAKTFSAPGDPVAKKGADEAKPDSAPLEVGFDKVIVAVKAGQTAQRVQWKGQMSLVGNKDKDGKIVGLAMKTSASTSNAGLHNLDLLATDWKII